MGEPGAGGTGRTGQHVKRERQVTDQVRTATGRRGRRRAAGALAVVAVAAGLTACSTGPSTARPGPRGTVSVVAAENFWGSIAAQLGGARTTVTSIIANPNVDPHAYEPTASDARILASAQLVVVNGVGYDPWATTLLAADPAVGRTVLDVGTLLHLPFGANPHRWYDPADVHAVVAAVTADLARIDPADAGYFAARARTFTSVDLAAYHRVIASIRTRFAGTPIGASESIVAPLATALGLDLITPPSFLKATSEGTEPTAADKATIDAQLRTRAIAVYVENTQNETPDVTAQVREARAAGIPVVAVTETMTPAGATFQAWQVRQLQALETALAASRGA